ncbi:MAG: hypothetical protein FWG74_03425, partial [Planctomycetes bacterium]|nr:hypothetical protein [Planctomycetota bacterium]
GRMRPGARLKVAGKIVYADAGGNFRLDCAISGGKLAIPLRAGRSIGGEVRGVINIDWEKRAKAKKKALGNLYPEAT